MKKQLITAMMASLMLTGCASGAAASTTGASNDSSPSLRIQNGVLEYQDESGNWNAVANQKSADAASDEAEEKAENASSKGTTSFPSGSQNSAPAQTPSVVQVQKGEKGDKGDKGDTGAMGAAGAAGAAGTTGSTGANGKDGKDGTVVTIGNDGELFLDGKATGYLLVKKNNDNLNAVKLNSPAVKAVQSGSSTDVFVSWNSVPNAASYTVMFPDFSKTVKNTSVTFNSMPAGTYTIQVIANPADGEKKYASSDAGSVSIEVKTITTPLGTTSLNSYAVNPDHSWTITWNAVSGAASYNVTINGVTHNTTTNSITWTNALSNGTSYSITVEAVPADTTNYASSVSNLGSLLYSYQESTPSPIFTPTPSAIPDTNTEEGCLLAGKYWYNNTCNDSMEPTPTPMPTPTAPPSF